MGDELEVLLTEFDEFNEFFDQFMGDFRLRSNGCCCSSASSSAAPSSSSSC